MNWKTIKKSISNKTKNKETNLNGWVKLMSKSRYKLAIKKILSKIKYNNNRSKSKIISIKYLK